MPREHDDGAVPATAPGGAWGTVLDLDGSVRTEAQLISKYREMAENPEVENAIQDVVNESIVQDPDVKTVTINLDDTKFSERIKERIRQEFDGILNMLNFGLDSYDIFRRWYIDGRLYYHVVIDPNNPREGIRELRYIDPLKIRKVREVRKGKPDEITNVATITYENEYYVFNPKGFARTVGNYTTYGAAGDQIKIARDSIIYVPSGLLDKTHTLVISYLQKAIKPLNNLRSLEDAVVIYRISRAPERRIFYIDVGNLPKMKAEQYVNDIMTKFKNRIVYDANTGEVRDDRKFMTMLEDFWLPRREGGRGTEISTLPAGQNLGQLDDVEYFLNQLYKALGVPVSRLDSKSSVQYGRGAEINRDEEKFAKFVNRLQLRFSRLFIEALERQLLLKGVITEQEWKTNRQNIRIRYEKDAYYAEVRENEIWNMRLETLRVIDPESDFIGKYFPLKFVQNRFLKFTEDEISRMDEEMESEVKTNEKKTLNQKLSDLNVSLQVQKKAEKEGVVLDPETGSITPPEFLKADPTIKDDG